MATAEERDDIRRIRRRAADLSIGVGIIAILLSVGTIAFSPAGADLALPSFALWALGGVAGVGVYAASDLTLSRWFTLWSATLTGAGIIALIVIYKVLN
ncbi:hypothetical protein [Actinoplanes sp. TFC3]|uniref:hypothetical protein n=1 Tax=Actinoplanes sp. TFC3 TaxID=1710355 RepID=UPI0012900AD8|nr:hypothetical protein [Actinoplanes sp. TFC3]